MEKELRAGEFNETLKSNAEVELEKLQKIAPQLPLDNELLIEKAVSDSKTKPEVIEKVRNLFFDALKKKNPEKAKEVLIRICKKHAEGKKISDEKVSAIVNAAFKLNYDKAVSFIKGALKKLFG